MPPVGRPALTRGVFSFEEATLTVPDRVLLDTSFVVEALIARQPLHESCLAFLLRLAEADSQLVYSRLLELELSEATFQLALKERHPKDWKRFRYDGRARRRATSLMSAAAQAWNEIIEAMSTVCVEVGEVAPDVPALMTGHGLASYDAVHVATAVRTGVRDVVTLDAGFAAAPAGLINIYIDSSRIAACRRRRSR